MRFRLLMSATLIGACLFAINLTVAVAQSETPRSGGTLTIARGQDSNNLDPYRSGTDVDMQVTGSNVIEPLLEFDEQLNLRPKLAERWEVLDATTVRLFLRQGVVFHDGTPFNADAVIFNHEHRTNPERPGNLVAWVAKVAEFRKVDDHTVDAVMTEPFGPALLHFALPSMFGQVSPTAIQQLGEDLGRGPVGTGPFRFVEWRTNDRITLERFDDYWGEPAHLERVVYRVIPEASARTLALLTGEVDMILNPSPVDIPSLKTNPNVTVQQTEGTRAIMFMINTRQAPTDDVAVRRALVAGTDRHLIAEHVVEDAGAPLTGHVATGILGYRDLSDFWAYDPDRARQMLDEAGWIPGPDGVRVKDGQRLELDHWYYRNLRRDGEVSEAWQSQMREIGVHVNLQLMEYGAMIARARSGPNPEHNVITLSHGVPTGHADYLYSLQFHSDFLPPNGFNLNMYASAELDALIEEAYGALDFDEARGLYEELAVRVADAATWIPMYVTMENEVIANHVRGYAIHRTDASIFLWDVWKQ